MKPVHVLVLEMPNSDLKHGCFSTVNVVKVFIFHDLDTKMPLKLKTIMNCPFLPHKRQISMLCFIVLS